HVAPVVRVARARIAVRPGDLPVGPFLADPQGRRHLGTPLEEKETWLGTTHRSTRRPSTGSWRRSWARASTDVWPKAARGQPPSARRVRSRARRRAPLPWPQPPPPVTATVGRRQPPHHLPHLP